PSSIADAPAHAGGLVRLCGAPPASVIGAVAIALGESVRVLLQDHAPLFTWLEQGAQGTPPAQFLTESKDERGSVERLRAELRRRSVGLGPLAFPFTRDAALLLALVSLGVRAEEQLAQALCLARMPSALAEAFAVRPRDFASYPMRLPDYEY